MTYDEETYKLAAYFLDELKFKSADSYNAATDALAQVIQQTIEDWLEERGL